MDLDLKDRIVLVTGGSKGIGLACAQAFASEGARVAISARDEAALAEAARALTREGRAASAFRADLSDPAQARAMVRAVEESLGPIDVLVTCAGAAKRTPAFELKASHWHAAMDAKYFTTIHAMDAVLPGMAERRSGAIVNVVGLGGKVAAPVHLPGGSANAALMLATAGLANAYAGRGIRINAVNPGLTATGLVQEVFEAESRRTGLPAATLLEQRVQALPLGRMAQPEEIANVVVFLASPRASYMTGAIVSVDGASVPLVV